MNRTDERIVEAIKDAHAFTSDNSEKIYITADSEMTALCEGNGWSMTLINPEISVSERSAAAILQAWYNRFGPLRFIQKVFKPHSPNKYGCDLTDVIPQFDGVDANDNRYV